MADRGAVSQVFENLLSNALKFSPSGTTVTLVARYSEDNSTCCGDGSSPGCIRVEVRDEGPGLDAEDMAKLFGKFARLSAQPTGGEHSTGLGLSIVKRLVEGMQGRIWCESEREKGAVFIVELPAAGPNEKALQLHSG
jgi:signal transduction histidine kinase